MNNPDMSIYSINLVGIRLQGFEIRNEIRQFLLGQSRECRHDQRGAEELSFDVFYVCRAAGMGKAFFFEKASEPGAELFVFRVRIMAGEAFGVV